MTNNIERVGFDMPADIIFDVLSRLPVKSLIRYKSVSKTWYTLIETPEFVQTHKKMQPKIELDPDFSNLIITVKGPGDTRKCSLLHISDAPHILIESELSYLSCMEDCVMVGVCNGLVCVASSCNSPDFIICNPTTGQLRQTPEFRLSKRKNDLIFLGFCLHVNGYEIIRIIYTCMSYYVEIPVIRAEIYSKCTDTWREIDVILGEEFLTGRGQDNLEAVLIDGVFYWKAECFIGEPSVAYFDKSRNVFDVIYPPLKAYEELGWQLHELKEELAVIIYQLSSLECFDLWVRNEDMKWTMIHMFDLSETPCYSSNWFGKIRVLGSTRNGKLVLIDRYENYLRWWLYDLNSEETKCLHDVGFEGDIDDAYLYTLSLTPVNWV